MADTEIKVATSKVPAAENTLRILKLLASKRGPMAASSIATSLGLPRSSVYHLLGVMEANGFVLHLHEEQRYGLGISAFELSSAYSRQEPLSRLGRPLLASLVDVIGDLLGLTWCRDSSTDDLPASSPVNPSDAMSLAAIDEAAMPHIVRLREFLRIGYTRGIEAEIKLLEQAAPQAQPLVRQLYDCLDRYDLATMARLVQEQ